MLDINWYWLWSFNTIVKLQIVDTNALYSGVWGVGVRVYHYY